MPSEHNLLADLPPEAHAHVLDLRSAPELAVLAVLHAALRNALVALIAEHPTLVELGPPSESPTLRYAESLLQAGQALSHALSAYRAAVRAARHPAGSLRGGVHVGGAARSQPARDVSVLTFSLPTDLQRVLSEGVQRNTDEGMELDPAPPSGTAVGRHVDPG